MRHFTFIKTWLVVLFLMLGVGTGWAETVTFKAGTDVGNPANTITKNGITLQSDKFDGDSYYQTYSSSSLTITSSVGDITKVSITSVASGKNKYGPSFYSVKSGSTGNYSYSGSIGTWSGTSSSITLEASSQVRFTDVEVTYTPNEAGESGGEEEDELAGAAVVLDFTNNDNWSFPESSSNKTVKEKQFSNGTYTVTVVGSEGNGYYHTGAYLLIGKQGGSLTLPAFDFEVGKIIVCGTSYASAQTKQNIFVGSTPVSTETTSARGNNTYEIDADYQGEGTIYRLEVTSAHNTHISKIAIYAADGSTVTPDPGTDVTPETIGTVNFVALNDEGYYATFSSDKDVIFPADGDAIVYSVRANGEQIELTEIDSEGTWTKVTATIDDEGVWGYYVPANTGVLLYAVTTTADYYYVKDYEWNWTEDADYSTNMLRPASETMTGDYKFYKLAYDDYTQKTNLGFYYGADNGAAFTCKAGTAYMAVPEGQAVKSFTLSNLADAIKDLKVTKYDTTIYNIMGQRVSKAERGMYIMNGKKCMMK